MRSPRAQRGPLSERQRRLRQRALPLAIVALAAFIFGVISSAGNPEKDMAERFVKAWAQQDFTAMHDELSESAQAQYSPRDLATAYREAQQTATASAIDPGDADGPKSVNGTDVVDVDVAVRTNFFGKVEGVLRLPLDGGKVAWNPSLTFPGLRNGERAGRRLTVGRRAPILAKHDVPLATGPTDNRSSPLGSDAIDVAGETGLPDSEAQARLQRTGYPTNESTGVSGLELAFNSRLAGRPSGRLLAVPANTSVPDVPAGTKGRVLATAQGSPGQPVRSTIDPRLQTITVNALGGQSGGAVVLNAQTGAVLALAGSAYSAPQPPGSTFKVITTTAALEGHDVKLTDTFPVLTEVNPDPQHGARVVHNAHDEACGGTFVQAFAKSCNSVFAPLGVKVGAERLVDTAERYGWNQPVTLYNKSATALAQPNRMTMPTDFSEDKSHTELSVTAFGQGRVLATPLGMASVAQTVANDGVRSPTPIVRDPALRSDADPVQVTSKDNARVLKGLMRAVVTSGTGVAANIPGIQVAGKTGTAELGPRPGQPPAAPGEENTVKQIVDGWFIAFAPARKPKLAVAVMLIDADGDGGSTAAPIARQIFEAGLR
ncbi:MAG TPA: penicillin-binding transpeptidase domain-containing protein [Solirubrobacterales bacterium]|nr:penicillin-binding transpeptidase domain-containing protein [Solirubrobacterales bacterium]